MKESEPATMTSATLAQGRAMAQMSGTSSDRVRTTLFAKVSDPSNMGWMQVFPPLDDKVISNGQSDFFSFSKLRWSLCHVRELLPAMAMLPGLEGFRKFQHDIGDVLPTATPRFRPNQAVADYLQTER